MLWCILVFSLTAGENIAERKPAEQSSTFSVHGAWKAVDGDTTNSMTATSGSCSVVADDDISSWWIVDLQDMYTLETVRIFNRDIIQWRLDGVKVEGFEADPVFYSNAAGSLCGNNPGPSSHIVSLSCNSGTVGRYVRVAGGKSMTICEAQIYGEKLVTTQDWKTLHFLPGFTSSPTVELGYAEHRMECFALCRSRNNPSCTVAAYDVATSMCSGYTSFVRGASPGGSTTLIFVPRL